MLIITRKAGEGIRISLHPAVDPKTPIGEIFSEGPIEVVIARVRDSNVRLGVQAHSAFLILREELELRRQTEKPLLAVNGED